MLWFYDNNGVFQLTGAGLFALPIFLYLGASLVLMIKDFIFGKPAPKVLVPIDEIETI